MIKSGGEAVSIQALADKVHNAGLNVEETIKWMWAYSGVPIDNYTLLRLREEYENVTGLLIDISTVGDNQARVHIVIQDPLESARFDNILALMEMVRK